MSAGIKGRVVREVLAQLVLGCRVISIPGSSREGMMVGVYTLFACHTSRAADYLDLSLPITSSMWWHGGGGGGPFNFMELPGRAWSVLFNGGVSWDGDVSWDDQGDGSVLFQWWLLCTLVSTPGLWLQLTPQHPHPLSPSYIQGFSGQFSVSLWTAAFKIRSGYTDMYRMPLVLLFRNYRYPQYLKISLIHLQISVIQLWISVKEW